MQPLLRWLCNSGVCHGFMVDGMVSHYQWPVQAGLLGKRTAAEHALARLHGQVIRGMPIYSAAHQVARRRGPSIAVKGEIQKQPLRPIAERLPQLWCSDAVDPDLVLALAGVEQSQRVAVRAN